MTPHSPITPGRRRSGGFTLLEMVIVLSIVALVLGAVHTITQSTLTLADDIARAQRQDARQHAFTAFCDRLFSNLPGSAALNLKTTGDGGQYLAALELFNVPSPFDGVPGKVVMLRTESMAGGALRLLLECRNIEDKEPYSTTVLFEDLGACEWRVYTPATRQWDGTWTEPVEPGAMRMHPPLIELNMNAPGSGSTRRVFWIAPNTTPQMAPAPQPPGGQPDPNNPNNPNAPPQVQLTQ
ncbi:MAG: pilus assembly FimT family protein [Prosthecobacter sp.]